MDNSELEKDFNEYECSYETFRVWLLAKYIDEVDFDNYATILESIIKVEMHRDQYDRTKNVAMDFLNEIDENIYRRMEIKDQFLQWVKDYTEYKEKKDYRNYSKRNRERYIYLKLLFYLLKKLCMSRFIMNKKYENYFPFFFFSYKNYLKESHIYKCIVR